MAEAPAPASAAQKQPAEKPAWLKDLEARQRPYTIMLVDKDGKETHLNASACSAMELAMNMAAALAINQTLAARIVVYDENNNPIDVNPIGNMMSANKAMGRDSFIMRPKKDKITGDSLAELSDQLKEEEIAARRTERERRVASGGESKEPR